MLSFQILSLLSLVHSISSIDLPTVTTPSTTNQLLPRQLFAGCGLNLNIWGQVSPTRTSGYANLCLQCRVNILGFKISFGFYDALATSISAHGVSASDAAILQSSIQGSLRTIAARSTTVASCKAACTGDPRCASSSFSGTSCTLTAVNYVNQNRAGRPLAQAFQNLFSSGDSQYCSICPRDNSCGPRPSGVARRSLNGSGSDCPTGQTACPITATNLFTDSTPYECLDVKQEITSCGGCTTLGQGVDCSKMKGVSSSGCSDGACKIFSCQPGYQYSAVYNSCHKTHRSLKPKL